MPQKFNNGRGSYLCDRCEKTMWVGHDGALYPSNRIFLYETKEKDVKTWQGLIFCSADCMYEVRSSKRKKK